MDALEKLKRDFDKWRSERSGKCERIPDEFRRRVVGLMEQGVPRAALRRELGLNSEQLKSWATEFEIHNDNQVQKQQPSMTVVQVCDSHLRANLKRLQGEVSQDVESSKAPRALLEHHSGWRMSLWTEDASLIKAFVEAIGGQYAPS